MTRDTWRDAEGFGRDVQVSPGVWSAIGPDDEDHAIACEFITTKGVLPCNCDQTRKKHTEWWRRWLRWQQVRVHNHRAVRPIQWPVTGPDGYPWVPGVDFNDN